MTEQCGPYLKKFIRSYTRLLSVEACNVNVSFCFTELAFPNSRLFYACAGWLVSTYLLRQASFASHAQIGCGDLISCVPTSGEFIPRLGISASFGENLGLSGIKGFFKEIVFSVSYRVNLWSFQLLGRVDKYHDFF